MATDTDAVDYYGHRLAAVNVSNPVVASEDILNKQGALLLSKGSQLSESRAELIAKHKLVKPLEHSVDVAKSLDAEALMALLLKFSANLPGLNAVVESEEAVLDTLRALCKYYEQHTLIRQKLTVLASQLPEIYYNSLYSAMAGVIIALELELEDKDLRAIFIGGLMHNTGFLHLDPELTKNESDLERDESLQVQAHPIIAKHFLDQVPKLPSYIGKVVLDHHERTDGTGYPKQKFGVDLTMASQVLAFTDAIVDAYKRCMVYEEHAHELMLIILQFNDSAHFQTVFRAAAKLIKKGSQTQTPPKNIPSAQSLVEQQERISQVFDAAKKLGFVLMKNTRNRLTKSIASMLGRLATSIISTGITQSEYHDWLESLIEQDDPSEHIAMLQSKVMLDELETQLERFKSILWKTITSIPKNEDALIESAIKTYNQIDKLKAT